jgi:hypothetical protein
MSYFHLTRATSAAIVALITGAITLPAIAQISPNSTTPISPTAPYNVQTDPNGNVQIAPGNVTQPSPTPLNPSIPANPGTTEPSPTLTLPISPTAPFGVQAAPNGNVQVFPGNSIPSGPSTNSAPTTPAGIPTSPISPTAPFGVQAAPNGNVQVFPGNNIPPVGNQTTPNAPGIIQIVPTSPSGTPQSTALPGSSIIIQPPTNSTVIPAPQPTQPQALPGSGTLDAQLLQATCNQNWGQAIQIVNQAIAGAPANSPAYRAQLSAYRNRLQALQSRGIQVPNWQQQCTQGFTPTQLSGR